MTRRQLSKCRQPPGGVDSVRQAGPRAGMGAAAGGTTRLGVAGTIQSDGTVHEGTRSGMALLLLLLLCCRREIKREGDFFVNNIYSAQMRQG